MAVVGRTWRDWDAESAEETASADESRLVQRARGDPALFGPLYERYVDQIYRFCFQALGNRESAEDATGQTFAKALAALPRYRDGSLRGWLFAIARNVIADLRRSRPELAIDDALTLLDGSDSPEQIAEALDARRRLHAALAGLTPDQRELVELRLVGLTGPEIAAALGKPLTAVKSVQFRAYQRLRELLSDPNEREEADRA
jgi:RNA polymerase sigma-70 factor (ECF subfamily)